MDNYIGEFSFIYHSDTFTAVLFILYPHSFRFKLHFRKNMTDDTDSSVPQCLEKLEKVKEIK